MNGCQSVAEEFAIDNGGTSLGRLSTVRFAHAQRVAGGLVALVHAGSRYLQGGPCEGIEREAKGQRRFAGSLREIEPRQIQLHDAGGRDLAKGRG